MVKKKEKKGIKKGQHFVRKMDCFWSGFHGLGIILLKYITVLCVFLWGVQKGVCGVGWSIDYAVGSLCGKHKPMRGLSERLNNKNKKQNTKYAQLFKKKVHTR